MKDGCLCLYMVLILYMENHILRGCCPVSLTPIEVETRLLFVISSDLYMPLSGIGSSVVLMLTGMATYGGIAGL